MYVRLNMQLIKQMEVARRRKKLLDDLWNSQNKKVGLGMH